MKTLLLCLALTGTLLAQQSANAPATREDIVRLFEAMHVKDQVNQTLTLVSTQIKEVMQETLKNRHPQATAQDLARIEKASQEVMKDYPVDQMLETTIPIYQKHLSKADAEAMITFYGSTAGQRILHAQPAIAAESMQAMSTSMQKAMADAMERVEKMLREERNKSEPRPAPTPKKES